MGIFVPTATIPSGIQLSNVYISLTNEAVNITQMNKITGDILLPNANYQVNSNYVIYPDRKTAKTKIQGLSPIRIPIGVRTVEYPSNPHQVIYNTLKQMYSNVQDVYETPPVTFCNLTVSGDTLVSLFKDINLDSNTYVIPTEMSNIVITHDAFSQLSNAINSFQFTVKIEPEVVPEVETSNVVPEVETSNAVPEVVETSNVVPEVVETISV